MDYGNGGMMGMAGGQQQQNPEDMQAMFQMFLEQMRQQSQHSGQMGIQQGRQMQQMGMAYGAAQNPFDQYRQGFGQQVQQLQQNPGSITTMPGYQAGLQAVERSMDANGYQGSGNMMAAIAKYAGGFYNDTLKMMGHFAGSDVAPGAGAATAMNGYSQGANMIGQGLATLAVPTGYGLAQYGASQYQPMMSGFAGR